MPPGAFAPEQTAVLRAPWDARGTGAEDQTRALHAAPTVAPVQDPVTGPQRSLPEQGRRGLPGPPQDTPAGDIPAPGRVPPPPGRIPPAPGRVSAPPREFGLPDEDEADAGQAGRRSVGGRLATRRPRSRSEPDDEPSRGARAERSGARASKRRLRLWLWTGVAAAVAAAAAMGVTAFLTKGSGGPAHTLVVPSKLDSFVRRPALEKQMNAKQLQQQVIAKSAGQASHVVSAVYENSAGVAGTAPPQIVLFIGGNLAGVSPGGFISSFSGQFKGAQSTSAGSLGGKAACVNAQGSAAGTVAMCTWADSDTFGVVASQTMTLGQLSAEMRTIRPGVERSSN
jgi:hypothetical protein